MVQRFDTSARLSEMTVHNGMAWLAGQVAADGHGDIAEQTRSVLASIDALLSRAGTHKGNIVMAQIFLADLADFPGLNQVWDAWVAPGAAPARATVQAALARPEWKVEIVVTAAI
jgi:enamine deaminase RidA (YjgF/YER057c/UK114 family)